jgi:hypothetical protein
MRASNTLLFLLLASLGVLGGCDSTTTSDHVEEVIVESYLVANEPLPPIWLTKSISIGDTFNPGAVALRNAHVVVNELDGSGSIVKSILFLEASDEPGAYHASENVLVRGGHTYRLEVDAGPSFDLVTAVTTVPDDFELIAPSATEIEYKDPEQYSMLVTQSEVVGGQSVFVFTMESLDPTLQNLIPAYFEFIFDEDYENIDSVEWTLDDLREVIRFSSPPIFEGNYEVFGDGTLRVKLPWFVVAFYGPLRVTMTVLDKNLYDFQRYQQVQQGGSTLSPGEIPNVLDHVENGRGLFASTARVSHVVNILKESTN